MKLLPVGLTQPERIKAMRNMIMLVLLAVPSMGGAALAASDSGTVSYVDTRTGTLRLSDGATYYVPNRLRLSTFHPSDHVRIQYELRTGGAVANDIVRTGRTEGAGTVISPTRDSGVRNNFIVNSKMCDPTTTDRNPCYIGP